MLHNFLFFLALVKGGAEFTNFDLTAPPTGNPIAQNFQRSPPNLNAYLSSMREKILFLQQKNAELTGQVIALQSYRQRADVLQQRLGNLEQKFYAVSNQNQDLQTQMKEKEAQIEVLSKEQAEDATQLQQCSVQLKQAEQERQERMMKIGKLNDDLQKMQASLKSCSQQLQQNPQQVTWLNEEIENKNKRIKELIKQMGDLNQQNHAFSLDKAVLEQQLLDKAKRLETAEKSHLKSLNETKEKEAKLQSVIDGQMASFAKLRQDYDLLKSQFNQEVSINRDLRLQLIKLEEEFKNRQSPLKKP